MLKQCSVLVLCMSFFLIGCAGLVSNEELAKTTHIPENLRNIKAFDNISESGEYYSDDPLQNIFYMFNDADLHKLMVRALEKNTDVLILSSKIKQARSAALIAGADLFPKVGIGLDYSYSDGNYKKTINSAQNNLNISATFSWELDIFGKAENNRRSLKEQVYGAEQDLLSGRVSLLSDVASYYFTIRNSVASISIQKEIADNYKNLLNVYKIQLDLGLAETSDVLEAENNYFNADNALKNLQIELEKNINALLILIDDNNLGFDVSASYNIPKVNIPKVEKIPTMAILNRPDVKSSVFSLNSQFYKLAGSKAAMYPSLSISGNIGQIIASSTGVGDLIWQVAGSLAAPLLNRKEIYENYRIQEEYKKQAMYTLQKTVNTALSEIENSLFQISASDYTLKSSQMLYRNSMATMELAVMKFENGLTDEVEYLKSRNEFLNAEKSLDTSKLNNITASINFYKAFGGSFGKPLNVVDNGTDK